MKLNKKQKEVLKLIVKDFSEKEIMNILNCSSDLIDSIKNKFNTDNLIRIKIRAILKEIV